MTGSYAGIEVTRTGLVRMAVVVPGFPPTCGEHPAPGPDSPVDQVARMRDVATAVVHAVRGARVVAVLDLPGRPGAVQAGTWWLLVAALADVGISPLPVSLGMAKRWATGSGAASGDAVLAAVGRAVPTAGIDDVAGCAVPLVLASMAAMASDIEVAGWSATKARLEVIAKLPTSASV